MRELISAFVTLFVTIDPPGLAPIFLGVTVGHVAAASGRRLRCAPRSRHSACCCCSRSPARRSCELFGITIDAFRIAGGLLLFHIAFEMIFEKRQERQERSAERAITADHIRNIAIFPLAIPLIAGPGAISATILLCRSYSRRRWKGSLLILIVAINLAAAWLVFLAAERLDRLLGATGRIVLTRLLGLILAALAVQFVIDGVTAVLAAALEAILAPLAHRGERHGPVRA